MLLEALVMDRVWKYNPDDQGQELERLRTAFASAVLEKLQQDPALVARAEEAGAERLVVLCDAAEELLRRAMADAKPALPTPANGAPELDAGSDPTALLRRRYLTAGPQPAGLLRRLYAAVCQEHLARQTWLAALPAGACTHPPTADLLQAEAETARILTSLGARLPTQAPRAGTFGQPGVRDPDLPCTEYEPLPREVERPDGQGRCMGDGHYLCRECVHLSADSENWPHKPCPTCQGGRVEGACGACEGQREVPEAPSPRRTP